MAGVNDQLPFYQALGKLVKEQRLLKKLNQEDLAKEIDLSRVSVVNIEKGIQKVQVHTLIQISDILDIDLNKLKLMFSDVAVKHTLNEKYKSRIDKSEVGNIRNLTKNIEMLKKHL